jgi:hypothetical protein
MAEMTTPEAVALVLLDKIADAENWSRIKTQADQYRVRIIAKRSSTHMRSA